jgi:molybdenum cofactor cytidylyltransferase
VTVVQNKNWQRGIGSSIHIGMGALIEGRRFPRLTVDLPKRLKRTLAAGKPTIMLLVCDQPFVEADTIRNLIALREKTKESIIASSYSNTLGFSPCPTVHFFRNRLRSAMKPG